LAAVLLHAAVDDDVSFVDDLQMPGHCCLRSVACQRETQRVLKITVTALATINWRSATPHRFTAATGVATHDAIVARPSSTCAASARFTPRARTA
jgi:hypothetical protein